MVSSLSVVMIARNEQDSLQPSVESIMGQDRLPSELVYVDDGSADGSVSVMRQLAAASSVPIRIETLAPTGRGGARARGVELSRSDYVAFLDADDVARPGRLAAEWAYLDRHPDVVAVATSLWYHDGDGSPVRAPEHPLDGDAISEALRAGVSAFPNGAATFRRSVHTELGLNFPADLAGAEDLAFWRLLALRGLRLERLPEIGVDYRYEWTRLSHRAFQQRRLRRAYAVHWSDEVAAGRDPGGFEPFAAHHDSRSNRARLSLLYAARETYRRFPPSMQRVAGRVAPGRLVSHR